MWVKQLWRFPPSRFICESYSESSAVDPNGPVSPAPRGLLIVGFIGSAAFGLGGCAQQPQVQRVAAHHSKEYFPSSKYGAASPRVVEYGEPVPRGGGMYMVGKPYSVAGHTYYPSAKQYAAVGYASWYGDAFHGRRTANGEVYDLDSISAAHPTMPLPSYARVTNLRNHYSMIVRVNDRGPFDSSRIMDVSRKTAEVLDFHGAGTTKVKVEYLGPAGLEGSDDNKLVATLRNDGPARFEGVSGESTMVAERAPVRTASAEPESEPAEAAETPAVAPARASAPLPVSRPFAGTAPLPPARPFDLASNSGSRGASSARTRQANLR
ncbi:septal ring lytic transglycosylase RlpA family protein [Methylocapsa acidiphila]|uniref:septal ring lytic transglycosylase RlpA family protein n=1 Tax=Methylocapsa acidiphila TaxID=133552 RepID=UPI00047D1BE1|nr:septal ring lytic transglycosylase RlpA family protein [Methylocapsa acidiphila]